MQEGETNYFMKYVISKCMCVCIDVDGAAAHVRSFTAQLQGGELNQLDAGNYLKFISSFSMACNAVIYT